MVCWLSETGDVVCWEDSGQSPPVVEDRIDELSGPPAGLQEGGGQEDVPGGEGELVLVYSTVPGVTLSVSDQPF